MAGSKRPGRGSTFRWLTFEWHDGLRCACCLVVRSAEQRRQWLAVAQACHEERRPLTATPYAALVFCSRCGAYVQSLPHIPLSQCSSYRERQADVSFRNLFRGYVPFGRSSSMEFLGRSRCPHTSVSRWCLRCRAFSRLLPCLLLLDFGVTVPSVLAPSLGSDDSEGSVCDSLETSKWQAPSRGTMMRRGHCCDPCTGPHTSTSAITALICVDG